MNSLPNDWKYEYFGNYIEFAQNGFGRRPDGPETGPVVLRLADVSSRKIDLSNTRQVAMSENEFQKYSIKQGDILFVRVNGSHDFVARSIPVLEDYSNVAFNDHLIRVKLKKGLDAQFLHELTNTPYIRSRLLAFIPPSSGGQLTINQESLAQLKIPLPPIPEQRKIAEILSTWDEAIAASERLLASLRERKKGLMQRLLTPPSTAGQAGQVRFAGFEGEWVLHPLGKYGKCIRGVSYDPKTDLYSDDTPASVRLLRANNISDGRVNTEDLQFVDSAKVSDVQYLHNGDIAICIASGSKDLVGKTASFDQRDNFQYTIGAFCALYRANRQSEQRFIRQLLLSSEYRKKLRTIIAGTNINNLRPNEIEQIKFHFPPTDEEMQKIALLLESCDNEIDLHTRKLEALQQQKKGLMQRLLTGAVRVKV